MHLLCDLRPRPPPAGTRVERLSSSGTEPTAAPSRHWTSGTSWSPSGRTCSHPSWRNASWRCFFFVWLCGSLFPFVPQSRPDEIRGGRSLRFTCSFETLSSCEEQIGFSLKNNKCSNCEKCNFTSQLLFRRGT